MLPRARTLRTTRHQSGEHGGMSMFSGLFSGRSALRKVRAFQIAVPLALLVAGCGGEDSSPPQAPPPAPTPTPTPSPTPTPTAFTNWQTLPTDGVLTLSGSTVEAAYVPSAISGTVGSYNTPGVGTAKVDITYTGGASTAVTVTGSQSSIAFRDGDGSTKTRPAASPNVITYASPSGDTSLLFVDAVSAGYSFMSYGAWTGQSSTTGFINSFRVGSLTNPQSVPSSGSAIYNGTSTGYYSSVNGSVRAVTADITITIDFGTRTVSYEARNSQGASTLPGLNFSGQLAYSSSSRDFSGTFTTPQGFGTGVLSGPVTGSFYGPNGEEVSGAFVLNWSGGTVGQYVVSFGAKRQ